jgi:NAD(P)-dependent dehydrogenase (short-subunit alcohol dehydrogenase family)
VFNNAALFPMAPIEQMPDSDWDRVIGTNLVGTFLCSKAVIPIFLHRKRGRIINITSGRAFQGAKNGAHYAASKAGIIGFTRALALETAHYGITVNAICPGVVETEIVDKQFLPEQAAQYGVEPEALLSALLERIPIGRVIHPDEVSHLAVYLGSDESDAVTGQSFTIAGGYLLI